VASGFNKFQQFVGDLGLKVHNLDTDAIKIYLTNVTPNAATMAVKADLAEIATGSGYSGAIDVSAAYSQSGGVGTLTGTDQVVTASGGSVGPFRYVVLYNDTPTSPMKPLIGWWDYGSSVSIADGEAFTHDFGASVITIQ
jgi:hypothetical protein